VAVQAASAAEAAEAHQEAVVGLDEGEGAVATMRGLHPKLLVSNCSFLLLETLVAFRV
jgi:hypothetical protein